jgi:hypothetical protein
MPGPILTTAARIMCAHGGQVTLIPKQVKVLAGGAPVVCLGDLMGAPIVGCAQPTTGVTVMCTAVVSEIPIPGTGMSPTVMVGGKPVLLGGINGLTNGVPPSPLVVAFPGQVKVMA